MNRPLDKQSPTLRPARAAARMPALALAIAGLASACGDDTSAPLTTIAADPSGRPLATLTEDERRHFDDGDALFDLPFRESQGLGPLYIRQACSSCHASDARGPGTVTKMTVDSPETLPFGHTVRPQLAAGATVGITAPANARTSLRVGPAVFGRGYLEAVADDEIEGLEARQAAAGGSISGRINRVAYQSQANPDTRFHQHQPGQTGLIGRFGLKARIASVDEFTADAFQGDMGLTSPLRPTELPNPDGLTDDQRPGDDVTIDDVNTVGDYVRALAIPRRAASDPAAAALFAAAGCAACHVPALRTRADYPIAALAGIAAPLYTDLLLHDMGTDLADGIADGDASGSEWRTAPLMGLRFFKSYLHDGRAKTLADAIAMHAGAGSEANDAVAAFQALEGGDRDLLIAFVGAL